MSTEAVEHTPPEDPTDLGEIELERVRLPEGALVIIDGPSAGGKSLLGQKLGKRYGLPVYEGGTFNRVATVLAFERGADLTDPEVCGEIARQVDFELVAGEDGSQRIIYQGRDITADCKTPEVSEACAIFSTYPESQKELYEKFVAEAGAGNAVLVGRMVGRWLLPDAPVKAFVTGKVSVRAARRGEPADSIHRRDMMDGRREHMPLRRAPDAKVFLNNEGTTFKALFCEVAAHFERGYGLEPSPLVKEHLAK